MSTTRRYYHTEILDRMLTLHEQRRDLWLQIDRERILLQEQDYSLASKVAAAYHDSMISPEVPYDDGCEEETALMEEQAEQRMLEPSSEEESDTDAREIGEAS